MARRQRGGAEAGPSIRPSVDWKYTVFYLLFYSLLFVIALFGKMAET